MLMVNAWIPNRNAMRTNPTSCLHSRNSFINESIGTNQSITDSSCLTFFNATKFPVRFQQANKFCGRAQDMTQCMVDSRSDGHWIGSSSRILNEVSWLGPISSKSIRTTTFHFFCMMRQESRVSGDEGLSQLYFIVNTERQKAGKIRISNWHAPLL